MALRTRVMALMALALILTVPAAAQPKRVALVIGNSAYQIQPPLPNPRNDAAAMAKMLRERMGFEVLAPVLDGGLDEMDAALDRFAAAADGAEVALFFYAGHGMELDGDNLLVPVDARLRDERDARRQTVQLSDVLRRMERARAKVVLLDACRDNPVASRMARINASRGPASPGLAEIRDVPAGMLIAFAAAPGRTAADGRGENSPFTKALLENLPRPGEEIRLVLGDVSQAVYEETRRGLGQPQQPWVNFTALGGRLYLMPAVANASAPSFSVPLPVPQAPAQARTAPALALPPRSGIPAHECDALAQPPRRLFGRVPSFAEGVEYRDMDGPGALAACQRAVQSWPEEMRFRFQLARSLEKQGRAGEALPIYRMAAERGYAPALVEIGYIFGQGALDVPQNEPEAVRLYRLAAQGGYALGMDNLGVMLRDGRGTGQDDAEAVRWFSAGAEFGLAASQNNLGWMHENGRGVPQNTAEAARLYKLAADQGHAPAQNNLGFLYSNGRGVPRNDTEALRLYRLASDQGDPAAQTNLGLWYEDGRQLQQSYAQAARLYRMAADRGYARAQVNLGLLYANGSGMPKNETEAVRLYRLAAAQGYAYGQNNLAWMVENGLGAAQDRREAVRLYRLAARQGNDNAIANLRRLGEREPW